jgi:outer membrane biosynthesis protein TonB
MLRIAVALSTALHGALGMWVEVREKAPPPALREQVDSWSGAGIEVDSVPAAAPAAPAAAIAPAEPNVLPPPAVAEPAAPRARSIVQEAPQEAPEASQARRASPARTSSSRGASERKATIRDVNTPDASTAAAAAANTTDTPSSTGAAFGAAGLPAGVRHLPKAFTRALGIASRGDKRWLATTAGPVGEARIELAVDENGRLGELVYANPAESRRLAPVVRHLLGNALLLLANGRFSLDPSKVNAGVQRLRVRVELTERVAAADPNADPEHEYEAPTASRPGHGSFTLEGGRRVTSWVYLE